MPHVYVLALIPSSDSDDEIEERLGAILYPHAYYFEFEPVTIPCECTWSSDIGIHEANKNMGDFHKLWNQFQSTPEDDRPAWGEFIKEWQDTALQAARSSADAKPPDPECDVCGGSGTFATTNPPTGLRYEAWAPNQWERIGRVSEISLDPSEFDSIITPDGRAHERYGLFRSRNQEEWANYTTNVLQDYESHLALKCFVNK